MIVKAVWQIDHGKNIPRLITAAFDANYTRGKTMKLYDTVRLKEDNPAIGVTTDNLGSVVDVLGDNEAYTVEFFDSDGNTIEDALFTEFTDDQLEFIAH